MNKDDMLKQFIRDNLDKELKPIEFSKKSQHEVLNKITKRQSTIRKFLDYEIAIPINSLVAVFAAFFITFGYMVYPIIKIDEEDISRSRIHVVKLEERR